PDTAWTTHVRWNTGQPIQRGTPPVPDAKSLVYAHVGAALVPSSNFNDATAYQMTFPGGASSPVYFRSPDSHDAPALAGEPSAPEINQYTFHSGASPHIAVR